MNKEFLDVLEETRKAIKDKLDAESKQFLDKHILERRLDGVHLDEEKRKKIEKIKEKISDLSIDYSKNCNEESTKLPFTAKELGTKEFTLLNIKRTFYNNILLIRWS